jgi:hypothetical protein
MKLSIIKYFVLIAFALTTSIAFAQDKSLTSDRNVITKANGRQTNVENNKYLYIQISLWGSASSINDIGGIWITNAHRMQNYKNVTYEEGFRIYKINTNSDGTYNYWTKDKSNGQTVLFELDQNGAVGTFTMSRYSPSGDSNVTKRVKYYLE